MGSTGKGSQPNGLWWDHPHIHGEHAPTGVTEKARLGSPPYTWGALGEITRSLHQKRITPIYMGSTKTYLGTHHSS